MTSWLDQLQPASLDGVPFQVDSIEVVSGDQVVVRDYPFGELPVVFRMGESAERIRLSAYVVGDDYAAQRDALRRVLTGERVLIHPTAGAMRVFVAGPYTMREAPLREGCVVRFDLALVRAELRPGVTAFASTQAEAVAAAKAAKDAGVAEFAAQFYPVASMPSWAQEDMLGKLTEGLDGAMGLIGSAVATVDGVNDTVAGAFQSARAGLSSLLAKPAALAGGIRELFELPSQLTAGARAALRDAYFSVVGLGRSTARPSWAKVVQPGIGRLAVYGVGAAQLPIAATPTRAAMARASIGVDRLFDTLALAAWVEALAGDDMASYDQAVVWRGQLYTTVQEVLTLASTSPSADALPAQDWHVCVMALLAKGSADLQRRGRDQSRVTQWTPRAWMSIWAISYELYGTAKWADEIWEMNAAAIENPLLVPPGKPLRVARHA